MSFQKARKLIAEAIERIDAIHGKVEEVLYQPLVNDLEMATEDLGDAIGEIEEAEAFAEPWPDEIHVYPDGNKWSAHWAKGYTNMAECAVGFGDTPQDAIRALAHAPNRPEWERCAGCGIFMPRDRMLPDPREDDETLICSNCLATEDAE